ncbi:MAG: PAS domain-containing sensor histidine kinase [Gammaproteobacteria bacterium]|nr:PAS domain-containing sensor histidine kinase [Gammaproteobacteria bacterium]
MFDLKKLSETELTEQLAASLEKLTDSKQKSELQYLAHNLQTHQIELEMQNRELRDAQRELEESRNRYADLYDFAPIGYLTLNSKGWITEINLTGARMLGSERSNIINQPMTRWLAPEYRLLFLNHLKKALEEKTKVTVELKIKSRDNREALDIQLESTQMIGNDGVARCHTVMIDIAERKKYEDELILARDAAEQASQVKSQIISRISHEFRNPLNAIRGFAQVLEANPEEPLSDWQKQKIEQILKSSSYLLELVNDLLDLASIEASKIKMHLQPVNLMMHVQDSLDLMQPLADKHQVTVRITRASSAEQYIQADRIRLKQVLLNLISNAIKYNRPNGSVSISWLPTPAGNVRINITDTGTGISEADKPSLFEPFNRLYLQDNGIEGSGIGLTITRQLVERMGGKIGVISRLGEGSTFWIELPAK